MTTIGRRGTPSVAAASRPTAAFGRLGPFRRHTLLLCRNCESAVTAADPLDATFAAMLSAQDTFPFSPLPASRRAAPTDAPRRRHARAGGPRTPSPPDTPSPSSRPSTAGSSCRRPSIRISSQARPPVPALASTSLPPRRLSSPSINPPPPPRPLRPAAPAPEQGPSRTSGATTCASAPSAPPAPRPVRPRRFSGWTITWWRTAPRRRGPPGCPTTGAHIARLRGGERAPL